MRALLTKVLGDANQKTLKQTPAHCGRDQRTRAGDAGSNSTTSCARWAPNFESRIAERRDRSTICCRSRSPRPARLAARIGQRHFDVQLMGGVVLHQGKIAEMRTGEGKTLTATLPWRSTR